MLEGEGLGVTTDDSWKVLVSPAWLKVEGHSSGRDFIEVYDSFRDPAGWKQPGFNDDGWANATITPGRQVRYESVEPSPSSRILHGC